MGIAPPLGPKGVGGVSVVKTSKRQGVKTFSVDKTAQSCYAALIGTVSEPGWYDPTGAIGLTAPIGAIGSDNTHYDTVTGMVCGTCGRQWHELGLR